MPILTLRRRRPNPPRIITYKNPKWRKPSPRLPCPKLSWRRRVSFDPIGQMKTDFLDQSDGWDSNGQQHPLQLGNAFPQISEFNFPNSNPR